MQIAKTLDDLITNDRKENHGKEENCRVNSMWRSPPRARIGKRSKKGGTGHRVTFSNVISERKKRGGTGGGGGDRLGLRSESVSTKYEGRGGGGVDKETTLPGTRKV